MYSARSRSKAQVSLAKMMVSGPSGILDAAHRERAESARIAGGEDAVARHHHDGESAIDLRERIGNGIDQRAGACECAMSWTMISESDVVWK